MNKKNIYYDENWCCPFLDLCESKYFTKIFACLEDQLAEQFSEYDFYLYPSNGIYNPPKPIIIQNKKPRILIYFSDETGVDPIYLTKYFDIIFKSYMNNPSISDKVFPFPVGYHKDVIHSEVLPIKDRKINVFFSGTFKWNSRLSFYKELSPLRIIPNKVFYRLPEKLRKYYPTNFSGIFENSIINFTQGFASGLSGNDYSEKLYNSKIVLCPPGNTSPETFRHYEAMRAGCVIVSCELPKNNFYNGAPFVIVKKWKNIRAIISELLADSVRMQKLQNETIFWWKDKCSESAVAKFIIQKLH